MVGFMTPHFARFLVGPDFKKLVPASALLGGIVTLLVYDLCYLTGQLGRFNLYTGVVCSVLSVFFIVFYRRERHGDWA
jgi:iron complex transport system permease protein